MRTLVLAEFSFFVSNCLANIVFPHPVIECNAETGELPCLRGQHCNIEKGLCENSVLSHRAIEYSTDGKCGPQNGDLLCDPNATAYKGTCCSQYGWCGSSADHCGTGCVSGCNPTISTTQSASEPTLGNPQQTATATGSPTEDGTCGQNNGGTTCVGWPLGECCSEHGWCGNSSAHCGAGCQSGPCTPRSSATSTDTPTNGGLTTDGTCGRNNGGTTCAGWPQGECCSMYGFCGNSTAHCGNGCQSGPCTESPSAPGPSPVPTTGSGTFDIIGQAGVPAMHAGLLPNGRVVFLDKVENYTQLKLPNGQYAYSSEYDPATNRVVPLAYKTNAFCSGGIFLPNGDFISVGGNGPLPWLDPTVDDGFDAIRYLSRSSSGAGTGDSWKEPGNKLASKRWYPSVQTLPDGRVIVVSGSLNGLDPTKPANNNPTYEILSSGGISEGKSIQMDILVRNQPYYMYPFLHVLSSGQVFVFTAKESQIFDFKNNQVVRDLPDLAGDFRTYPNTGGSVLLPMSSANNWAARVMVCGGGAYQDITSPTDPSCGVITPEDTNPSWEMDSMPEGRVMVESIILPDGKVLWLNGANRGSQGFLLGDQPTLRALLYDPAKPLGARWQQLATSTVPRLYHSVALLLLDGTVMVAGSNPNEMPVIQVQPGNPYITEFRVERFTPPYLMGDNAKLRPTNVAMSATILSVNQQFQISFSCPASATNLKIALYYGGFVTHSVHMGHRMLFLDIRNFNPGEANQVITVTMPPNSNIVPPGPYVIFVVVDGIPSVGKFVQVV